MSTNVNFDRDIAPILHRIHAEAKFVDTHSSRVIRDIADLPARPNWETKAEDALREAEIALTSALSNVRAARDHYRKVKTEQV